MTPERHIVRNTVRVSVHVFKRATEISLRYGTKNRGKRGEDMGKG